MTDTVPKRPPTLAGACIYLGTLSAILSIRAATVVSTWNGDDRAAELDLVLDAMRDAGLSQSGAESTYRVLLTVVAVLAACGAVFAIFTARGDRASRVGLTVAVGVSGLAAFLGIIGGGFLISVLGALLVVFTVRLWTGEIRTYFRTLAGHAPPPPKPAAMAAAAARDPFAGTSGPVARQPVTPAPTAPPEWHRPPPGYHPQPWQPGREPLPKAVSIAVWTAFTGSIIAIGLSALMLLLILAGALDYDTIMEQGGPSADMVSGSENDFDTALRVMTVLASISVVIGVGGLLASIRVLLKRRAGGVPLFVMTVVALVVSVLGFPLGLPWTAATIVVWIQLRRPEARAWFSRA
jgi:hypothetical protein